MAALRTLVLILTFVTGFTGLVYDVTWHRYLSNLLGSQAQASAIILAVFLGGLSVGYAVFGALSRSSDGRALVRLCGLLEIGIGFWGVMFPRLYGIAWSRGGIADPGFVHDLGIAVLLIGPPTVLMGGTLPLLTQGLARSVADSSLLHARIYAINTAGAFVGALAGGFYLIPQFGLPMTVLMMGVTNVLAGALLVLLARTRDDAAAAEVEESDRAVQRALVPGSRIAFGRALVVAFIAGAVSITAQTVIIRLTGISVGSSEYAFAMVVGVFISLLAAGAWITTKLPATYTLHVNAQLLFVGLAVIYVTGDEWPYANHVLRVLFTPTVPSFYLFHIFAFFALGAVLFVPVTAMGGMMPLLFRSVDRNSASLGRAVGLLYCLNTAGCVTGALVGGYAALVRLDLDEVVRVCLVLSGVMFLLCSPGREEEELVVRIRRFLTFGGMVMLAVLVLPWSRERLAFGTFRAAQPRSTSFSGPELFYRTFSSKLRVVAYKDDPNTSVAIVESTLDPAEKKQFGSEVSRSLYVNGKSDGASVGSDLRTTRLVGHIPALLSAFESPNVAVVGFGLGGTVGTLTRYPEVSRVDVIEIAPAVRSFAPYFDEWNHGAAGHPKVRWNMGDAYRVLGASTERYSIIVSEPSNPWVAGVERLYAREFFEVVKRKLTAGGLYGQWFHTYSISEQTFGLILNTFRSAFPHVRVFAFGTDLLLLGGTEEISRTHLARLTERMQRPEVKEELEVFELATPEAIMGLEQWIDPEGFEAFGLHSLEFPQLAFAAGKDFFLQESVSLGGILENAAWGGRTRERARRSLIALHAGLPLGPDAAIRYGTVACGMSRLEFFDAWDRSSRACRTTLASLLLHGELSPGPHVEVDDPAMIGYLAGAGEAPPVEEDAVCDRAFRYLSLFGSLDSPLFELDTDRLRRAIAPCLSREGLDAEVVRTRLDAVLEATGRANAN